MRPPQLVRFAAAAPWQHSMKLTRPGMLPLKKIRFGLVDDIDAARDQIPFGQQRELDPFTGLGSKRAITSTWCWLTQM